MSFNRELILKVVNTNIVGHSQHSDSTVAYCDGLLYIVTGRYSIEIMKDIDCIGQQ